MRAIEEMISKEIYMPVKKIPRFFEVARDWTDYKRQILDITIFTILPAIQPKSICDIEYQTLENLVILKGSDENLIDSEIWYVLLSKQVSEIKT